MKIIIAGSRSFHGRRDIVKLVDAAVKASGWRPTVIVSGRARGIDAAGERWAKLKRISIEYFPVSKAGWNQRGNAAGPIRNGEMAKFADALIVIHDGKSSGTFDMIKKMERLGKPVFVFREDDEGTGAGVLASK